MLRPRLPFLAPVHSLDLTALRRAGRFASPEGKEGAEGGTGGDEKKPADKGGDGKGAEGGKPEGGEKPKPEDTPGRISVLVDERNAAQRQADDLKAKLDAAQQQIEQLKKGNDAVADLQKKLGDYENATRTRFDKLLETELSHLPEAAAKAVKSIPGGSEAQFDWLVANRALFQGTGEKSEEKKGPDGQPSNDKKPPKGGEPGASSVAKSYVEARKPKKAGFPGLTG